ncbi:ADP-ribosylation factor-like protein 15 isoform X2 [Entelurus aequoreus]|uniref:ADP-ribosylation factor-like protein 15 isoform X2 n=1 Tax=Entelurus aequoreus TaxID=161455 RepID=UPI002B1D7DF0|nr:ADP-ribosylation factor-like protein 15 isoform X2 [Entelurus aequoreus]
MDYLCFRALCCKGPPPPRPEYDVVCIGLMAAGKTSLLSRLCSEGSDRIVPTTGFSIKAVPFPNAILNVKELGGADNIKKYWCRYYQGSQGVVFVLDSASSDEDLEAARAELHSALQHPQLCTLPFLILANHQDRPAARTPNQRRHCTPMTFLPSPPSHSRCRVDRRRWCISSTNKLWPTLFSAAFLVYSVTIWVFLAQQEPGLS